MSEETKSAIQGYIIPIMLSVIGVIAMQLVAIGNDIVENVEDLTIKVESLNGRLEHNTSDIIKLQISESDRVEWVRDWIEDNQGAVDWAKEQKNK